MASTKRPSLNREQELGRTLLLVLAVSLLGVYGQSATGFSNAPGFGANVKALQQLTANTPAYRKQALCLVLGEANRIAQELHLPEKLPIDETNLVASYITPPRLVDRIGAIGNVSTANYTYYCSVGRRFSYVARADLDKEYARLREQWLLPMSQMDTNAAYQLAVQWLSESSMDVQALNRDCSVTVLAFTPQGPKGRYFVPLYWVYRMKGAQGSGSVASVELFSPTKTLMQLRVEDPKYILRKPLVFTNLASLLSQTQASPKQPPQASRRRSHRHGQWCLN